MRTNLDLMDLSKMNNPPQLDTTVQDWASSFIEEADGILKHIIRASISSKELAAYIASVANHDGGFILVGAYSERGYGSGFENVNSDIIKDAEKLLVGVKYELQQHTVRGQNIYLIKVKKSQSIAFADDIPYTLTEGLPQVMSEKTIIQRIGLGIDSSLMNMMADQITKQSVKIDMQSTNILKLTKELDEASKIKNQTTGLIVGGIIGWIVTVFLDRIVKFIQALIEVS